MYRVSPFTYLVNGMLASGLANNNVTCSSIELVHFDPPSGQTCGQYMQNYIFPDPNSPVQIGYLKDNGATANCSYCQELSTNVFLTGLSSEYSTRWRNFGIMWAFIIFNIVAALGLYWLARVPRKQKVLEEAPADAVSRAQTAQTGASKVRTKDAEEDEKTL